jgi:hypothetical protein
MKLRRVIATIAAYEISLALLKVSDLLDRLQKWATAVGEQLEIRGWFIG